MTDVAAEASVTPENRARLEDTLAKFAVDPQYRVYAVIEGALFKALSSQMAIKGIAHRSLYRDAKPELRAGGPWLVDPYHYHLTDEDLYELVGENTIRRGPRSCRGQPIRQPGSGHCSLLSQTAALLFSGLVLHRCRESAFTSICALLTGS